MKYSSFDIEKDGTIRVIPIGSTPGYPNNNLVRLEILSRRRHKVIFGKNLTADMARGIAYALLEAIDEVTK